MMRAIPSWIAACFLPPVAFGQTVTYNPSDGFPDQAPVSWERSVYCTPERSLEFGWFTERVEPGQCGAGGDRDHYLRSLGDFAGAPAIFAEWRLVTDGDRSELIGGGPTIVVLGGAPSYTGVTYWFGIARDEVRYIRDAYTVYLLVDIESDVPHTYRLELYGASLYVWTIDGIVVDCGVPRAAFPMGANEVIAFSTNSWNLPSVTHWNYVAYGVIPAGLPGDANCDGRVDNFDIDAFVLAVSDAPRFATTFVGCNFRNADANSDGRVDNFDIDAFVALLGGG